MRSYRRQQSLLAVGQFGIDMNLNRVVNSGQASLKVSILGRDDIDEFPFRSRQGRMSDRLNFLWLEITGRCQLKCQHCYADSSPAGTHGSMSVNHWKDVIDQAVRLGVKAVQFIGGEPTLHPGLEVLINYSLSSGMEVEVFTNLVRVRQSLWKVFSQPGVRLATSYYSNDSSQHDKITTLSGSYTKTRNGIEEALSRGIPLRVGVISILENQNAGHAMQELRALGVTEIGHDYLREVGRGMHRQNHDMSQLCGQCADGVLAVSPDGTVWPCVFSRWLPVGNVRTSSLEQILRGEELEATRQVLANSFASSAADSSHSRACPPDCGPAKCEPLKNCQPDKCQPWTGRGPGRCSPYRGPHHERTGGSCAPPCAPSARDSPGSCPPGACAPLVASSARDSPPSCPPGACAPLVTPVVEIVLAGTFGSLVTAFCKELGKRLGGTTADWLSRTHIRRRGGRPNAVSKSDEADLIVNSDDAVTIIELSEDLSDEAKLAMLDLDISDQKVRGKRLRWNDATQTWTE
jgi:MoaA/NifB/PqqE/SkfB family radical SAM enzyme